MSKKLLIATLGTSPAVVTEAVDLLDEQGVRPDGVILLMTQDPDVKEAYVLLASHLPQHDDITWVEPVSIINYGDVDTSISAVEFMQETCRILKAYRGAGHRLFVSIAGGRKAMSSLLTLAVQFYGAERLFHVWVPPWIEEEGEIGNLRNLPPKAQTERLHPPLDKEPSDRPRIVDLPFIGLFPLLDDILAALKGGESPTRDLKRILVANGLLTTSGAPTVLGQTVADILENVEGLPPARQQECKMHIAGHHFKNKVEQFAWELCGRFPFIEEIRSAEWGQGEEQVRARPPRELAVFARLSTDIRFQLHLVTTAHNPGQLETARQQIERFIRQRR